MRKVATVPIAALVAAASAPSATMQRHGAPRTSHSRSIVLCRRSVARLAATPLVITALLLGSSSGAAGATSDNASCVEEFNVAVGTPGEYQRVIHQDKLGRDVSFFARLG